MSEKLTFIDEVKLYFKFPIGCEVWSSEGCRIKKHKGVIMRGMVMGYTTWGKFKAVKVKKANGKTVTCLAKNLKRV